jgi:hypothetical protein
MATEYEFSATLVFWGDLLDARQLAHDLGTSPVHHKIKGEILNLPDGSPSGGVAKTGTLSCDFGSQGSVWRREPEDQLLAVAAALGRLATSAGASYGISEAELQLSIYYRCVETGQPDFSFPPTLLDLLARHRIGLRMTVLP